MDHSLMHTKQRNTASGFTLVEVALVLLVMGLFIGAVISFAEFEDDRQALQETQYRQKRIAIAISDYANRYGKVPCPAPYYPDPPPTDGNFGYSRVSCTTEDDKIGIVPYMELGLSSKDVIDGYGNYMSFIVFLTATNAGSSTTAHSYCRTPNWVQDLGAGNVNLNPMKARFCCARDTDVNERVFSAVGVPAWPRLHTHYPLAAGGWRPYNDLETAPIGPQRPPLTYFAYSLISHGKNGSYAPLANETQSAGAIARIPTSTRGKASIYDDPRVNGAPSAATLRNFFRAVRPLNLTIGEDYYDNIVLWRTQEQVISETGISNCSIP